MRYVIAKTLHSADATRMNELRDYAASVENRITSIKWSPNHNRRIVERLNLRSLDITH
jgi:hypothetical protein